MLRLDLTIELENDTMQTGPEVSAALRQVARTLALETIYIKLRAHPKPHKIHDINGNSVGQWEISHRPTLTTAAESALGILEKMKPMPPSGDTLKDQAAAILMLEIEATVLMLRATLAGTGR